jgi:hypothetical protein
MAARILFEAMFGRANKENQPEQGLTFGYSVKGRQEPLLIADDVLRSHIAISGRNGNGIQLLNEQLLRQQTEQGRGWVFVDTFGDQEMLDRMAKYAKEHGRSDEFYVLDLGEPERSNSYSILHSGDPEEKAARVLRLLPSSPNNPGADFYRQQAWYLLTTVFAALAAAGKSIGLRELAFLLARLWDEEVVNQLLDVVPAGAARTQLLSLLDSFRDEAGELSIERLKQVSGGVSGRLYSLCTNGSTRNVIDTEQPEIEFSDILLHNKMCYVKLPPVMGDQARLNLIRMVLHDIATSLEARARLPHRLRTPFLCLLECYDMYGLSVPSNLYERARAMRVALALVIRSEWDYLATLDEERVDILSGNTFTKVFFQQRQGKHLTGMLPALPAGTLDALQAGEFILYEGSDISHGRLEMAHLMELKSGVPAFKPRRMMPATAHERLKFVVPGVDEVIP